MENLIKMRIIVFILIQAFLFSINAFALETLASGFCEKSFLSPSIKIKVPEIRRLFENLTERDIAGFSIVQERIDNEKDKFHDFMKQKIMSNGGRINFAEFMGDALYSEYGYFINSVSVGRNKDFDTHAQELPFAYALAGQLIEMWEKMDRPEKFSIVEMGAGSGELVKNIIAYIQQNEPRLYESLDYVIVEISPKLVEDQKETLLNEFESLDHVPVRWIQGTALDLSKLENIEGVFLSNEMPDNFPVHRIKKVNGEIQEIYVTVKDGEFRDELGALSTDALKEYADAMEVELGEGAEIPVNLNLRLWQENMARALKRGFVITIDYGGKPGELSDQPQAVWNKETNKMTDSAEKIKYIYEESGTVDITANVNFFDAARWGKEAGLNVHGYALQRDFLWNLGFDEIIEDMRLQDKKLLRSKSLSAEIATNFHFKVLVQSKGVDTNIPLAGLKKTHGFHAKYAEEISVVLPIGRQESEFIVVSNDFNFQAERIKKGIAELRQYLGFLRDFRYRNDIIKPSSYNLYEGKYVLTFKRKELSEKHDSLRIYNDLGELIFDSKETAWAQEKEKTLAITEADFNKRYLSRLDLNYEHIADAPKVLYVHSDGSLLSVPQGFLLQGAVDKKESLSRNQDFMLEQSI